MADPRDRWAHLEERQGLVPFSARTIAEVRRAYRRSLPTRHHAKLFFDALARRLGERGHLDDTFDPGELCLHLRDEHDARLVIGSALARLTRAPGAGAMEVRTLARPDAPDAPAAPPLSDPPQIIPRGPEMCAGALTIAEGLSQRELEYDERGLGRRGCESSGDPYTWSRHAERSPYLLDPLAKPPPTPPISLDASPDLEPEGLTPEALAELAAASRIAERVGWRVHVPVPVPASIEQLVAVARGALRLAAWRGEIPEAARWAVADGLSGTAIAWGEGVDDALARFEQACFARKPRVPGPPEPPEAPPPEPVELEPPSERKSEDGETTIYSTGTIHLHIPARPPKFPWPRPIPANVPAVLLPLPPLPATPPGFDRVVRCIGEHGAVGHLFVRDTEDGHLGVGEHVLDLVDLETIAGELDEAEREMDERLALVAQPGDEAMRQRRIVFSVFDDGRRARMPAQQAGAELSITLGPPAYDGDLVPWRVVRQRRT